MGSEHGSTKPGSLEARVGAVEVRLETDEQNIAALREDVDDLKADRTVVVEQLKHLTSDLAEHRREWRDSRKFWRGLAEKAVLATCAALKTMFPWPATALLGLAMFLIAQQPFVAEVTDWFKIQTGSEQKNAALEAPAGAPTEPSFTP